MYEVILYKDDVKVSLTKTPDKEKALEFGDRTWRALATYLYPGNFNVTVKKGRKYIYQSMKSYFGDEVEKSVANIKFLK